MSKVQEERRERVMEAIIKVLAYYKAGTTVKEISEKVAKLYGLGRFSFEQEVDEHLRELEREGRVARIKRTRPDGFVWYTEIGSNHSFLVWHLTKEERARLAKTSESSASMLPWRNQAITNVIANQNVKTARLQAVPAG